MKKIIFSILLTSIFFTVTRAQTDPKDPKAKSILAQTSAKYRTYNIVRADFTLTIATPQSKANQVRTGVIYAQSKTSKFKLLFSDQELLSDGKTQWNYLKDDKEIQITDADKGESSVNPAQLFTMYEKGFKYLYVGDGKINGRATYTIDLSPEDIKRPFFKVRISVDKVSKMITNAIVFDKSGSKFTYLIKAFTPAVKVADSFFTFDAKKYPGVEIVDLR